MTPIKSVEELIRLAIDRGEFNDLAGQGKPVDLSDYFNTPENIRLTYSILKNAGILPEEIENFNKIEQLKLELKTCANDKRKKEINKRINELLLNTNLIRESKLKNSS